jgi:hypothetical protein
MLNQSINKKKLYYLEIIRRDAAAIIDDLEGFQAVVFQRDFDGSSASIQAVFNKLLDCG